MAKNQRYKTNQARLLFGNRWSKLAVGFFVLISMAFMFLSEGDDNHFSPYINDIFSPVIHVLSYPSRLVGDVSDYIDGFFSTFEDNKKLKIDNDKLLKWQNIAIRLESENNNLRQLLGLPIITEFNYITAAVIGDVMSGYRHSFTIDAGEGAGAKQGDMVVSPAGVVGHIVSVGANSARVLSITDINSRIPVRTEMSNEKAILAGHGSDIMTLTHLGNKVNISVGDRVVTSSEGELIPAGIMVGEVVGVQQNVPEIRSYIDFSKLDYISVANERLITRKSP